MECHESDRSVHFKCYGDKNKIISNHCFKMDTSKSIQSIHIVNIIKGASDFPHLFTMIQWIICDLMYFSHPSKCTWIVNFEIHYCLTAAKNKKSLCWYSFVLRMKYFRIYLWLPQVGVLTTLHQTQFFIYHTISWKHEWN